MITTQSFFSFGSYHNPSVRPLTDMTLSNHFPIQFSIEWQVGCTRPPRTQFFFNTSLLSHYPSVAHIQKIWKLEGHPTHQHRWIDWWNFVIQCTLQFLSIYGLQLANFCWHSYEATMVDLCHATKDLVANPFSPMLQVRVAELRQ